ncbi:MAG: AAA-like domain-containing protein [Phormidesmis sp.]
MNTHSKHSDDPQNASDFNQRYRYKVGGSLAWNDSTYIPRQGDSDLYQAIQSGAFCHVLGPRQVGKSSLRIRTSYRLRQAGYCCASVQATELGGAQRTLKFWDKQLISLIWDSLHPEASEVLLQWFKTTERLSAPQRLEHFVRDLIFADLRETPIVIFIDEIDYLLDIPAIVSQFFSWIAKCYSLRTDYGADYGADYGDYHEYHPLSFVIVGTAIATDLAGTAPACIDLFHSAQAIALDNFQLDQLQPLYSGLASIAQSPAALPANLLAAIMHWTNGQPFLTQKLCHILFHRLQNMDPPLALSPRALRYWIAQVIQLEIIDFIGN